MRRLLQAHFDLRAGGVLYTAATVAMRLRLRFSPGERRVLSLWLSRSAARFVPSRRFSLRITMPLPSSLNTRRLESLFGAVEISRCGYSAPEEGSLFPLDGELNLPKDSNSHGLRERLASEVVRRSFDEAMRAIETTTGARSPSVRPRS